MTIPIPPWKTFYFYRKNLNPTERAIYETIRTGLMNWAPEIDLREDYDIDRIYSIYTMVLRDNPMLFHAGTGMRMRRLVWSTIIPEYTITPQEYDKVFQKVVAFALASKQKMDGMDTYHLVKNIHDAMVKHVIYNESNVVHAHNIIGAILEKKAVCESIAKAFKILCDANQIPCIVVFGYAGSTDGMTWGNVDSDDKDDNHAWNRVQIGNHWYNIDVTFDIGQAQYRKTKTFRYDFFCRSDAVFSSDHRPSFRALPACDADHSVYRSLGNYAARKSDLVMLTRNAVKRGQKSITFEYHPNLDLPPEEVGILLSIVLTGTGLSPATYENNTRLRIMHITFE